MGHEWSENSAYVMPELPKSLRLDPIVAALIHVMAFLELSCDDMVDPDAAVEAMEHVGFYLQRLPARRIAALGEQLARVAAHAEAEGWGDEAVGFFNEFVENLGLSNEEDD